MRDHEKVLSSFLARARKDVFRDKKDSQPSTTSRKEILEIKSWENNKTHFEKLGHQQHPSGAYT
jgi:hypothetical protein